MRLIQEQKTSWKSCLRKTLNIIFINCSQRTG